MASKEDILYSMVAAQHTQLVQGMSGESQKIMREAAATGNLGSSRTIIAISRIGIDALEKVLDTLLRAMKLYWSKVGTMDSDLNTIAQNVIARFRTEIVDELCSKNPNIFIKGRNTKLANKALTDMVHNFSLQACESINHTAVSIAHGIDPFDGTTPASGVNVVIADNAVVNSAVYGDIQQSTTNIQQTEPDLAQAINNLLDLLSDSQIQDQEPMELLATVAEEAEKPVENRRIGTLKATFKGLREWLQTANLAGDVTAKVNALIEWISSALLN